MYIRSCNAGCIEPFKHFRRVRQLGISSLQTKLFTSCRVAGGKHLFSIKLELDHLLWMRLPS